MRGPKDRSHLFKKGQSGNPGGRPKGWKRIDFDVAKTCENLGCDPFEVLVNIAKGDAEALKLTEAQIKYFGVRLRLEAAVELGKYLAPTLKSVDVGSDPDNPVQVVINLGNDGKQQNQISSDEDSK